jgi:hypothetical protein
VAFNCSHQYQVYKNPETRLWTLLLDVPQKTEVVSSLLPMRNPLPSGIYRIRAFDGSNLLTMPDNTQNHQDSNVYIAKRRSDSNTAKFQTVSNPFSINVHNINCIFVSVGGEPH